MKILRKLLLILVLGYGSFNLKAEPTEPLELGESKTLIFKVYRHSDGTHTVELIEPSSVETKKSTFIQRNKGKVIVGALAAGVALYAMYSNDISDAYIRLIRMI